MQEKNKIIETVSHFGIATTNENHFLVAQDVIDRLFISNYFSVEQMANFIKNELTTIFNLSQKESEQLIKEYEDKQKRLSDKLQIAKLKSNLQDIPIYEKEILKCMNLPEVQRIVAYIVNNIKIYNIQLLKDFVINDLSKHFELTEEEKKEVMEVLEDECSNIEEKDI